jgi:Domain of unknown function (DUF4150)
MPFNQIAARKAADFRAVSTAPSFNKTPVGAATPPLPYPTIQDLSNSVNPVASVRFNGNPAYVLDQTTQPSCIGDAPGSALGVRSNKVDGKVEPTKASKTVNAGKHPVVRNGDACTMNGGNNPGLYVVPPNPSVMPASAAVYSSNPDAKAETSQEGFWDRLTAGAKDAARQYKDKVSPSLNEFAQNAMETGGNIALAGGGVTAVGAVASATVVGAAVGVPTMAVGGATAAVGGGVTAAGGIAQTTATVLDTAAEAVLTGQMPNVVGAATGWVQAVVVNRVMGKAEALLKILPGKKKAAPAAKDKSKDEAKDKPKAASGGSDGIGIVGNGGGDRPCIVGKYSDIKNKCPTGSQAHHIVPDYTQRTGTRKEGMKGLNRIKDLVSLGDGPSICLTGGSKEQGSEHNIAHEVTDQAIKDLGLDTNSGPIGTAPLGKILVVSKEGAIRARPDCKKQIDAAVDDAFKDVDKDKLAKAQEHPATGDTKKELDGGNTVKKSGRQTKKKG